MAHKLHESDAFASIHTALSEQVRIQRKHEQRLKQIEEMRDSFQQGIESTSEALFRMNRKGEVVQVNPAAEALLGKEEAELLNKPFAALWDTDDVPSTPWQLLDRAPSGTLTDLDVEIETSSDNSIPVSIPVNVYCDLIRDTRGAITGVLVIARDVTERKRAERRLRDFAELVAHELDKPLRNIIAKELAAPSDRGSDDSLSDVDIERIRKAADQMRKLIDALFAYSKTGKIEEKDFVTVDCTAVIEEACANLQAEITANGLEVAVENDMPTLRAHRVFLVVLFQNLINNAIKYSEDGPPRIRFTALRLDEEWQISAADNGKGLGQDRLEDIFEFGQHHRVDRTIPGLGIGLTICKQIVNGHGGRMWAESDGLGQGSTFSFTMPAVPSTSES